jgi:hypothetical protein
VNTVLIPCFRRPEFLQATIDRIHEATGAAQYQYIFRLDQGFDPMCEKVISTFQFPHQVTYTPRTSYTITKQSYSVLTGLQMAARTSELVFLIEEDVLIGRDFFQWHEHIHAHQELFSSHANKNINSTSREGQWDDYYLTTGDYGSIGTCIPSAVINKHINPHINPNYFRQPWHYIKAKFPTSTLGTSFVEQDGLIRRIQPTTDLQQAYPCTFELDDLLYGPRCYHAGFYGKNRPNSISGNYEQRKQKVDSVVYSQAAMRHVAVQPGYYEDSRPCALELPTWQTLTLKH